MRKKIEVPTSRVKKGLGRKFIFVIEIKDNRDFYLNSQEGRVRSVSVNVFFFFVDESHIQRYFSDI